MPHDHEQPAPSRAWREGDHPGRRQFVDLGDLALDSGARLPGVRLAYETWGTLSPSRDNAVLVLHALTGDSHVTGPAGPGHPTPGWWDGLVGPGAAIDTDRWFVVAPNVLGGCQGSTGPSSPAPDGRPWGSRFPFVTVRDQVAAEIGARRRARHRHLGQLVLGGSMGGMRALEWAVEVPDRVERLMVLAVHGRGHAATRSPGAPRSSTRSGPTRRGSAATTTTSATAPVRRPASRWRGRSPTPPTAARPSSTCGSGAGPGRRGPELGGGRYAVESYLDHHGGKLARRFDAGSYVVLTEAMNSHDVGRDRGGVGGGARPGHGPHRGGRASTPTGSTRCAQSEEIAAGVPGCRGRRR